MKKTKFYIIVGCIALFNFTAKAQLMLPYYTGFDTPTEQAGWQSYKFGVNAKYGPWGIFGGGFSTPKCLFHDYNNTGTVEDWYVSPALNFTSASKMALKIKVYAMMGSAVSPDYIGIWYSSAMQNPASGDYAEVVNLTSLASSGNKWVDTTINLPFKAGAGYIGLKYMNGNNWFTIAVDNINVTAGITGIGETKDENNILIYPNPTTGKVIINNNSNLRSIKIYNLLGEKIYYGSEFSQQTSNNIDLSNYPKGIHFAEIYDGTNTYTKKIILQ